MELNRENREYKNEPASLDRGYLQVYTGKGKGKTTAALGLAIRAAGSGLPVYIGQFIKGNKYSELIALERFSDLITVVQYGRGCFITGKPDNEDLLFAKRGLKEICDALSGGHYSVVIADELLAAHSTGMIDKKDVDCLIDSKPDNVELIITGRDAPEFLLEKADLVTVMQEYKHYYTTRVQARKGIEY